MVPKMNNLGKNISIGCDRRHSINAKVHLLSAMNNPQPTLTSSLLINNCLLVVIKIPCGLLCGMFLISPW